MTDFGKSEWHRFVPVLTSCSMKSTRNREHRHCRMQLLRCTLLVLICIYACVRSELILLEPREEVVGHVGNETQYRVVTESENRILLVTIKSDQPQSGETHYVQALVYNQDQQLLKTTQHPDPEANPSARNLSSRALVCHNGTEYFVHIAGTPGALYRLVVYILNVEVLIDTPRKDYVAESFHIYYFDVVDYESRNAPLEIKFTSNQGDVVMTLLQFGECPTGLPNVQTDAVVRGADLTYLTWSQQATVQLTTGGNTDPVLRNGRLFIGVQRLHEIVQRKNFTITIQYGMKYSDYVQPTLLLLLVSVVAVTLVLVVLGYLLSAYVPKAEQKPSKYPNQEYRQHVILMWAFFFIPGFQYILLAALGSGELGDRDICYYNERCMRPWWIFNSFNNVWSNCAYVCAGTGLCFYIMWIRKRNPNIFAPGNFALVLASSVALIFEGVMSSVYHICPTRTIFQFDTAFMFVIASICTLELYRKIHGSIPNGYYAHVLIAAVIFFNFWGSLVDSIPEDERNIPNVVFKLVVSMSYLAFWGIFVLPYIIVGKFWQSAKVMKESIKEFIPERRCHPITKVSCAAVLFFLVFLPFLIEDNSQMLLAVVVVFMVTSTAFYVLLFFNRRGTTCASVFSGIFVRCERTRIALAINLTRWGCVAPLISLFLPAMYLFNIGVTNKELSPHLSRDLNKACAVGNFYDYHDLWHVLGAFGLMGVILLLIHLHKHPDGTKRVVELDDLK